MYNRYIRNDNGVYERVSIPDPYQEPPHEPPRNGGGQGQPPPAGRQPERERRDPPPGNAAYGPPPPPPFDRGGRQGLLNGLLGKLKLDNIDTGDLLLLAILFLLFKDGGDDELLIALGLLLIL